MTDDTRQRSVAEILGFQALCNVTPDHMLAWLRARGFNVDIDVDEQISVMPWNSDNDYPDSYEAATLHAALEAAVRAVAEVSDE